MVDFSELRRKIENDEDRVLFDEAVTCHRGGAYRAAFVFAWIAAAEGLLNKLDAMGTAQADIALFVKNFKAEQTAGSAKDNALLDQAKKVGFVDATEHKALDGVRDLRNQYGHPTAVAPTETAAAAAIETAVLAVLTKPALLHHGGARQLAERLGADLHFIPNDADAIAGWTVARAPLIADAARPLFIRTLIEQHAANLGQLDEVLSERCRLVAGTALAEWGADLAEDRWAVDSLQQVHGPSAAVIFSSEGVWGLLNADDQFRILSRCLEVPTLTGDPKLTRRLLSRAFELHDVGALNQLQADLIIERVQAIDGSWLVSAGAPVDLLLDKAAGFLNDGSFEENKKGARILDAISKPVLVTARAGSLEHTGAALARAARRNAFVAKNLIDDIARQPDSWPLTFRAALAVEGATEPWFFQNEYTARQAMRLSLQDIEVALAVQAAIPPRSDKQPFGINADDVIESIEERIAEGGTYVVADAVPVVREILGEAASRYVDLFGDDS